MKWSVRIKPNAKKDAIEKMADGTFKVSIKAPPFEGKANVYLVSFLAKKFEIKKSEAVILKGENNPFKTIEINLSEQDFLEKLDLILQLSQS